MITGAARAEELKATQQQHGITTTTIIIQTGRCPNINKLTRYIEKELEVKISSWQVCFPVEFGRFKRVLFI